MVENFTVARSLVQFVAILFPTSFVIYKQIIPVVEDDLSNNDLKHVKRVFMADLGLASLSLIVSLFLLFSYYFSMSDIFIGLKLLEGDLMLFLSLISIFAAFMLVSSAPLYAFYKVWRYGRYHNIDNWTE